MGRRRGSVENGLPRRIVVRSTMRRRLGVSSLSCVPLVCSLLMPGAAPAGSLPRPAGESDPCALLTPREIESVQGETVSATKSSRPERGRFAVSQCFYTLPTFSRSISLEVIRRDAARPAAASPREHWREIFHLDPGKGDGEAGDIESGGPQPVPGVGDEAFWMSDGVVGALYVLKGDVYLRVSLGGSDDPAERIRKSKILARKALARL
jgi:hypothetical protein